MDISLLSQNTLVVFSLIAASLMTFICMRLSKPWIRTRRGFYVIVASLAASGFIEGAVQHAYSTDKLPSLFWLMTVPFTLSVGLVVAAWKNRRKWLKFVAIGGAVFNLLFSLILINGYYSFYPTFGSVFNVDVIQQPQELINLSAQSIAAGDTIESSLYSKPAHLNGEVKEITIPATVSKFKARAAYVYIPAIASSPSRINLPVIVLLAGFPGLPNNWLNSGLQTTMDEFAKQHHGISPIVFMVDDTGSVTNDTECVNSPRGNVETYLTVDVPNYINAHYSVASEGKHWAIGGLSMGGMCGFMLAARHPNIYDNFIDLGGETAPEVGPPEKTITTLFGGSKAAWEAHQPLLLMKQHKYNGMNAIFGDGNTDSAVLIAGLKAAYIESKGDGMNSVFLEVGGGHTFSVWQELFKDTLPWLSNQLGATECNGNCKI